MNDDLLCIRVNYSLYTNSITIDKSEIHPYSLPIPATTQTTAVAPSINITRTARRFDATSSANVQSWQYRIKNNASCGVSDFQSRGQGGIVYKTGSSYTVPANSTSKYVCFRAQGVESGLWGYKISLRITTRSPVISVAQNNRLFTASGFNVESWQYVTKNGASCGASAFASPIPVPYFTGSSFEVPLSRHTQYNGKYICFRARSVHSGVWGYKSKIMSVLTQSPVIRISQESDTGTSSIKVTATATPSTLIITSWRFIAVNIDGSPSNDQADCRRMFGDGFLDSRSDILANKEMIKRGNSGVLNLASGFSGKWICIEATVTGAKGSSWRLCDEGYFLAHTRPIQMLIYQLQYPITMRSQ